MANSFTAGQVVTAGFALSAKNRPELVATQAAALARTVDRTQRALFQFASRVNPQAFMATANVPLLNGRWDRPIDADAVWRIEHGPDEVLVVPYDDRAAFPRDKSVYRLGSNYYANGNGFAPTGTLTFFYSRRPTAITDLNTRLDQDFPEAFVAIFEFEVAAWQARADGGRDGELEQMIAERNRHIALFESWLEHETMNETRRMMAPRRFASARQEPLQALTQAG